MKRFRIFEDSAPFLLVLKKSVRITPPAYITVFIEFPDSTMIVWAWEGSSTWNQETKCEGKALEVTTGFSKVEPESRCFGTVNETRQTQH